VRTGKQESFIESYCQTGNATKAAVQAGYSEATAKQQGHVLKNKFKREIEDRIKKMVQDSVPAAMSQISQLAQTATSEQVRLAASRDILDRAGLKPPERVEQKISHEDKSTDELRRELEALTGSTEPEIIPELVN
jgi:phage terminase small subunit